MPNQSKSCPTCGNITAGKCGICQPAADRRSKKLTIAEEYEKIEEQFGGRAAADSFLAGKRGIRTIEAQISALQTELADRYLKGKVGTMGVELRNPAAEAAERERVRAVYAVEPTKPAATAPKVPQKADLSHLHGIELAVAAHRARYGLSDRAARADMTLAAALEKPLSGLALAMAANRKNKAKK